MPEGRYGTSDFTNPASTAGSAASAANLNALARIDDEWFVTNAAGDNNYNYHMYNITVDNTISNIAEMEIYWVGWGEGFKDPDEQETRAWVWNWNSMSWETIHDRDDVNQDSGFYKRVTSNYNYYINSVNNRVTVKVRAHHETTCAGCPFIYGWSGAGYKLLNSAITASIMEKYESTSYDTTGVLQPRDGYYDLMVYMPLEHTGYINELGLWVVDHAEGVDVIADAEGVVHTIADPQAVTAVDSYGRDVTSLISTERGTTSWKSDLSGKDFSDVEQLHDSITVTLPGVPDEGIAKLLVNARWTDMGDFKAWHYLHYILGSPNLGYLMDRIAGDEVFGAAFDREMWLNSAIVVEVWNGEEWEYYTEIAHPSMFLGNTVVIPIDLSAMEGDQVRIVVPAGMAEIGYVAVDYSPDEAVSVTLLEPVDATKSFYCDLDAEATCGVLDDISGNDDAYAVIQRGDYVNYRFAALADPAEGMERSFVVPVSGYYYYSGPEVPEDKMDNLAQAEALIYEPNAFHKYILPQYVSPEDYPFSGYYVDTYIDPSFELDQDALNANYVGVIVAECTNFNESPHSPLKVGDWWMWNVSYSTTIYEDAENCYDFTHRNYAFQIETVNSSGQSVVVFQNSGERTGGGGHTVSNATVIDGSFDRTNAANGRGNVRAVLTGTSVMGIGDQAENYMLDNRKWTSPWDAGTYYKMQSIVWVVTAINEETLSNNWYTLNSDTSNHAAEKYGYPYLLGDSLNTHEYYFVDPDSGAADPQNVERDWNTRVVSYVRGYNASNSSEWMFADEGAYDHDGNASNAVYDVWVSDQYQTSDSYQGGMLTPESGSRIHWYSPEVKNDVRRLDAYQYQGGEHMLIQAYEVGSYIASNLSVSWGANTNFSVDITNYDCEHGKYINVLGMILDTNACPGSNTSECYINGQTIYPDVHNPTSTTVWPFYDAIKHVYFNASETKTLTWNTTVSTAADSNYAVWCQGQYLKKP